MGVILVAGIFGVANGLVGFKLAKSDENSGKFITALPLVMAGAIATVTPFAAVAA